MNEQITDFCFYCIFRKSPNFYGNGVYILEYLPLFSGPLGWLNCTSQVQSNTEKYLNQKQLRFDPGLACGVCVSAN